MALKAKYKTKYTDWVYQSRSKADWSCWGAFFACVRTDWDRRDKHEIKETFTVEFATF